jgi:hypothetical protein
MSSKDQTIILQAASTTITTALKKYPARISPRAYRLGHLQAPVRIWTIMTLIMITGMMDSRAAILEPDIIVE